MNNIVFAVLQVSLIILSAAPVVQAQSLVPEPAVLPVDLGNISGAMVTLYHYDADTGGKGEVVGIPDNPQLVQWDEQRAAPGTYTFTRVPEGTYYIEAVHAGHRWFAIATVNKGTTTANVAIPPNWTEAAASPAPVASTPTATSRPFPDFTTIPPEVEPLATPAPVPTPKPTPEPGLIGALSSLVLAGFYLAYQKKSD